MTTVAYCAVSPNGRTFSEQMFMREDIVPRLRFPLAVLRRVDRPGGVRCALDPE
jgi:hypothetical protein